MKVGCIFAAWQCVDLLPASLAPWVEAKRSRLGGHEYTICAVSVPFEGFPQEETRDNTRYKLGALANYGEIDHVVVSDKPIKETDARGKALQWLVAQGCDTLWQVDADEVYTHEDITRILAFVAPNSLIPWFRLSLRNAVFDERTFLTEPFTPPRVHSVRVRGYEASGFWDDNNVLYRGVLTRDMKPDVDFASMTVPSTIAWPKHYSWLSNARSKAKIGYQLQGRGWPECSFRWDETKGLQFNEAYYTKRGLSLPEVVRE